MGHRDVLTPEQKIGLEIFQGKGRCMLCHSGPELSSAGTVAHAQSATGALVNRMSLVDVQIALHDRAFYNTGVAPTAKDLGIGGTDPFGQPLSFARQAKLRAAGQGGRDRFGIDVHTFTVEPTRPVDARERDAVDGAFKVPTLRNVELTAPYFHTGSAATLDDVIEFYDRGGNRPATGDTDSSGHGTNRTNVPAIIEPLFLTPAEKAALRAFLIALTDERVRWEQAPFDHPQLFVSRRREGNGDARLEIPAVGAGGRAARGLPSLRGASRN
jgi:cytochrome c peroxidase